MSQYVDRKEAAKSYRPVAGSMSPGLKRAREPYRLKNALLGISLAAFAVGIWAYSISAVRQDVFDDVDEEVMKAPSGPSPSASTSTTIPTPSPATAAPSSASVTETPTKPPTLTPVLDGIKAYKPPTHRGVLPRLFDSRLPWLLDPKQKTLVWGAPSVDNIGKMSWRS